MPEQISLEESTNKMKIKLVDGMLVLEGFYPPGTQPIIPRIGEELCFQDANYYKVVNVIYRFFQYHTEIEIIVVIV